MYPRGRLDVNDFDTGQSAKDRNRHSDSSAHTQDSFGAFLTAIFTGWYNIFLGPLWTVVAQAMGLPVE